MNTFTVTLPEGVPEPKFSMWQRTKYQDFGKDCEGVIVGQYWVDLNSTLVTRIPSGWHYQIDPLFGAETIKELAAIHANRWEQATIHEDDLLKSAKDSPKAA